MFSKVFEGKFHNVIPYDLYTDYLKNSNIVSYGDQGEGLALCAPDAGAREFVKEMYNRLNLPKAKFILLDKERSGERKVDIELHDQSESTFEEIHEHAIVLFDDMVRTGSTVVKSCRFLKQLEPTRTVFAVTHFYASEEGREKMANPAIDEILTLNTLPTVLNRDVQGRLRRKMVVLKIERWLAGKLCEILDLDCPRKNSTYQIDMSSTNPRFIRKIWSNDQLSELHRK
jgi:ribose-phosphate pyrophosphokinase